MENFDCRKFPPKDFFEAWIKATAPLDHHPPDKAYFPKVYIGDHVLIKVPEL